VLLTRREDFHVWCLPGGHVDAKETLAQAAVREMREETGLEVRLTRLVGVYSRPGWNNGGMHMVSFAGEIVGGELRIDPHEVIEVGFFAPDDLPPLLLGHRQKILDAAAGIGGSVAWDEGIAYPADQPLVREDLYAARDRSGLAREAYYMQHFEPHDSPGVIEVKGSPLDQSETG
jgi:ADP-ribose pyrophosphatase YjhB (NUDIX family)